MKFVNIVMAGITQKKLKNYISIVVLLKNEKRKLQCRTVLHPHWVVTSFLISTITVWQFYTTPDEEVWNQHWHNVFNVID